jgi:hypothetical protein
MALRARLSKNLSQALAVAGGLDPRSFAPWRNATEVEFL